MAIPNSTAQKSRLRIGIFAYYYPVAYSPSILLTAEYFGKRGYEVDLFLDRKIYGDVATDCSSIHVHYCTDLPAIETADQQIEAPPPRSDQAGSKTDLAASHHESRYPFVPNRMRHLVRTSAISLQRRLLRIKSSFENLSDHHGTTWRLYAKNAVTIADEIHSRTPYRFFIGFDEGGAMAACLACRKFNATYYYNSLEIHHNHFEKPWFVRWGYARRIREAIRRAEFVLIQDERRAEEFGTSWGLDDVRFRFMPVSEAGPAVADPTNDLRERFSIGQDKQILLYVGAISDECCCLAVAKQTRSADWPNDWVVVFHGFCGTSGYRKRMLAEAHPDRVYLSSGKLDYDALVQLCASANAGICLYENKSPNFELTAMSSGKIALYLKCGLPLVVNDFPATEEFLAQEQCGIAINNANDLSDALPKITTNHVRFRERVFDTFSRRYDFESNFAKAMTNSRFEL